jgi:DNA-directed RNA polymerase subunit RPC12/RpoP
MEEKVAFAIGDRIDQMCVTCGKERGHTVAMISKKGRITRVSCPMCHSRVPYKSGTNLGKSVKVASPYDRALTYRRGQTMIHSTFGEGEVTALIGPSKIDVLFADRMRRLIHAVA